MKKEYITPETQLTEYMSPLMDNLPVASDPKEDDILGKDRKDDFEGEGNSDDNWSNGLW